jgi:hypothetical protein
MIHYRCDKCGEIWSVAKPGTAGPPNWRPDHSVVEAVAGIERRAKENRLEQIQKQQRQMLNIWEQHMSAEFGASCCIKTW